MLMLVVRARHPITFDIILNAFCAHLSNPELLEIIEILCCIVHVQVRKYHDQS